MSVYLLDKIDSSSCVCVCVTAVIPVEIFKSAKTVCAAQKSSFRL